MLLVSVNARDTEDSPPQSRAYEELVEIIIIIYNNIIQSLTVKQFQHSLSNSSVRSMAAASNVIPFGLLYMRPLQLWLRTKGFSSRGNPLCLIKDTQ